MKMKRIIPTVASVALVLSGLTACDRAPADSSNAPSREPVDPQIIHQVGSIAIYEEDVEFLLGEWNLDSSDSEARDRAIQQLGQRARRSQAALDAQIDRDPAVRAEIARIMASRHREKVLAEEIGNRTQQISEERLRERFSEQSARFRSKEKRRVAVLWLNPGQDPARQQKYQDKLGEARGWLEDNRTLSDDPSQGFSALSVDFSEHQATRFKGGKLGWLEEGDYTDPWRRSVAEIAFGLDEVGEVSPVVTAEAGVFLVRLMDLQRGVERSFESVRGQLEREERQRVKSAAEAEFEERIERAYPLASR